MEWLGDLGPTAGAVAVVLLFLKFISDKDKSQSVRDSLFAENLAKNTTAMQAVASATQKSAKEAEKRNGHLAELAIENKESTLAAIAMIKENIHTQHVDRQVVDKQTIKE